MKPTGPTNPLLKKTISSLKEAGKEAKIWKDIAKRLSKPTRRRAKINLSKINRYSKDGQTIAVPGKVLSYGNLEKKINISAFSFSSAAILKIKKAGGKTITLEELARKEPKGKGVRIMV